MNRSDVMKKYGYVINFGEAEAFLANLKLMLDYGCDDLSIEGDGEVANSDVEWQKLINKLAPHDEVVIPSLTMFTEKQALKDELVKALIAKQIPLRILKKAESQELKCLPPELEVLGQVKRHYVPGTMGRPKIDQSKVDEIIKYREKDRLTYREISQLTGISLGTVYKYINNQQETT